MLRIYAGTVSDPHARIEMTPHAVGTREEWLAVRKELLKAEKDHSRRGDELARRRRELPWVPIEKEYVFDSEDGRRPSPSSSTGAHSCYLLDGHDTDLAAALDGVYRAGHARAAGAL